MTYNKIVSVTGLGGLYELVSSKGDGGIVRSLEDKTSKFVSNRIHNFSHLESIEVYTNEGNVNLAEVFMAMQSSSEKMPDAKADGKEISSYFEKVYPDMDRERVYSSDMKKMIRWYAILKDAGVEISGPAEGEENAAEEKASSKGATAAKAVNTKAAAVKSGPARKINAPRKMA